MTSQERFLKVLVRTLGTGSATAAFVVVVPYAWMNAIHQWLGLATLPDAPVVGYLARSTSAFYALFGGLKSTRRARSRSGHRPAAFTSVRAPVPLDLPQNARGISPVSARSR